MSPLPTLMHRYTNIVLNAIRKVMICFIILEIYGLETIISNYLLFYTSLIPPTTTHSRARLHINRIRKITSHISDLKHMDFLNYFYMSHPSIHNYRYSFKWHWNANICFNVPENYWFHNNIISFQLSSYVIPSSPHSQSC